MGSALLNQTPRDESERETAALPGASTEALRRQVAERLAAHRARRARAEPESHRGPVTHPSGTESPRTRIAAAVAERYAQAQSYRAFLAAEAERAVQQARAVAEVAARNAAALAEAQQQLLDSFADEPAREAPPEALAAAEPHPSPAEPMLWPELEQAAPLTEALPAAPKLRTPRPRDTQSAPPSSAHHPAPTSPASPPHGAVRIVMYEDLSRTATQPPAPGDLKPRGPNRPARHDWDDAEALALDEEISFRQAPVFEEPAGPPMALPANLIEFPRQLIASRKARPRYAEGPLREEDATPAKGSQLRIFEVDPAQISTVPNAAATAEAQWTSLWLDNPVAIAGAAVGAPARDADASHGQHAAANALPYAAPPARPQTAALGRRTLSAAIDCALIASATLVFAAACAAILGHFAAPEAGWTLHTLATGAAAAAAQDLPLASWLTALAVTAAALAVAYQLLFFTFSEATPGMRLLRIGLCTFADDNPTRRAMRLRIPALILSTVTLGLGHLWVFLDEDHLTWHDLISRMYPRSY